MAEPSIANNDDRPAAPHQSSQDGKLPTPPPDSHVPTSSSHDSGLSKRPRDARLLHIVLNSYGVSAYQERVPLMLMDLAYRYTSSTLSDALHFSSEGYGHAGGGRGGTGNALSDITMPALRLSIHSRTHYQYNSKLSTAVYSEIAEEKNKVALPSLRKDWGTMLPPEQYCLMGNSFEMEEDGDGEEDGQGEEEDTEMKDTEKEDAEGDEEVEGGVIQDVFGTDNGAGEEDQMAD